MPVKFQVVCDMMAAQEESVVEFDPVADAPQDPCLVVGFDKSTELKLKIGPAKVWSNVYYRWAEQTVLQTTDCDGNIVPICLKSEVEALIRNLAKLHGGLKVSVYNT